MNHEEKTEKVKPEQENNKIKLENQKLQSEIYKLEAERLKITVEAENIKKQMSFWGSISAETLGKILLGSGSMAFALALFVYPYYNLKEAEFNSEKDSLRNEQKRIQSEKEQVEADKRKSESELATFTNRYEREKKKLDSTLAEIAKLDKIIYNKEEYINKIDAKQNKIVGIDKELDLLDECVQRSLDEFITTTFPNNNSIFFNKNRNQSETLLDYLSPCFESIEIYYLNAFKNTNKSSLDVIISGSKTESAQLVFKVANDINNDGVNRDELLKRHKIYMKKVINSLRINLKSKAIKE